MVLTNSKTSRMVSCTGTVRQSLTYNWTRTVRHSLTYVRNWKIDKMLTNSIASSSSFPRCPSWTVLQSCRTFADRDNTTHSIDIVKLAICPTFSLQHPTKEWCHFTYDA